MDEFDALGDMLGSAKWELSAAEEYKNDLAQPAWSTVPGIQSSTSHAIVPSVTVQSDPAGPCSAKQWEKVQKMVA